MEGMRRARASRAERSELGKRRAASNLASTRRAKARGDSPGWISITSSTAGTRRQRAANLAGVRMVRWRSGRPRRQASTAGILITASPSQLLERIKRRKGCRPATAFASGGWNPRRALPRRKGPGVFQRLWTQNQSGGPAEISRSRVRLSSRVSSSTDRPCGSQGGSMTQRQRATPVVWMATETSGAPVRSAMMAASGEVEANFRKSGVQSAPSPACWSTRMARIPPFSTRSTASR